MWIYNIYLRNSLCHWKQWIYTHSSAFGTKFKIENLEKIKEFANTLDLTNETEYNVVKIFEGNSIIPRPLFEIGENHLDIWGKGIEYPLFGITNIKINGEDIQELGNGSTIKFNYGGYEFIKFFVSKDIKQQEMFVGRDKNMIWTIVGKLTINEWEGHVTPQIEIEKFDVEIEEFEDNAAF